MILRESAGLCTAGLLFGVALALTAGRGLRTLLFGLEPTDPATMLMAAALLSALALLASYVPARRATKVDPMVALRYE